MSNYVDYISGKLKGYPMHITDYGVLVKADNLEIMDKFLDNHFYLLLTDPPYGIGEDGAKNHSRGKGTGFNSKQSAIAESKKYSPKEWDKEIPPVKYFQEATRVSKNQIIFGGNYFQSVMIEDRTKYRFAYDSKGNQIVIYDKKPALGATKCWIVWDKLNGGSDFADCELAWTSFDKAVRKYDYKWNGMLQGNMKKKDFRIHPTQKPVQLMRYLIRDYTKKGQTVLDTHSGSGTTAIACIDLKRNYLVIEKEKEYFEESSERIEKFKYGYNSILKDGEKITEHPQGSLL